MQHQKEIIQAFCPHCSRNTSHVLQWKYRRWDKKGETDISHSSYYVAVCDLCKEVLLYVNHPPHDDLADCFEGSVEADTVLVWPDSGGSQQSIPELVRDYYQEAGVVRNVSLNAYAISLRRALEAVCTDRGIDTRPPLAQRLQLLAFKDEMATRLNGMTLFLKDVGNIGAHADRNVTQDEARLINKLFRLIVDYLYVVPDEITKLKSTWAKLHATPTSGSPEATDSESSTTDTVN
jgi:hypothetical protein